MEKSQEQYQPSEEQIKQAMEMMDEVEKTTSKEREDEIKKMRTI